MNCVVVASARHAFVSRFQGSLFSRTAVELAVTAGESAIASIERAVRAFLEFAAAMQLGCATVIRDLDGKFSEAFNQVFKERPNQVKPVGPQAPNLSAFIERWIRSLQHEAFNHFVVFSEKHFDCIVSEYVDYYLELRPHQGIGNVLLPRLRGEPADTSSGESNPQPLTLADIKCDERLGGLLKHFYRQVA